MPDLPSHASPYFSPQPVHPGHHISEYSLNSEAASPPLPSITSPRPQVIAGENNLRDGATPALPASIVSPTFTPPATPGGTVNAQLLQQRTSQPDIETERANAKTPKLLPQLPHVECIVRARIPTTTGAEMFLHLYQNDVDSKEHLAIVFGNNIRSKSLDRVIPGETEMDRMIRGAYVGRLRPGRVSSRYDVEPDTGKGKESRNSSEGSSDAGDKAVSEALREPGSAPSKQKQAPLVRIHSECYTGETAWSARCDCGEQLDEAARLMSTPENDDETASGSSSVDPPGGVIVYLRQEGRGIGLGEKLKAYNLQDLGSDTVEANLLLRHPADARSYGLATAILVDLGLGVDSSDAGIRLLTNNPDKVRAIEGPNREVIVKERVPMIPLAWRTGGKKGIRSSEIEGYLRTKVGPNPF
ncbi:GTP cyclohydrolase-2 [Paecilomyces variotii No. 5]|uniref:GTP cyclohydrolase II n=1 Tax=Byssochlamys spectabilis (strain No. 5 / NBRC 109023) TaxID=1356009 RepID=V5FZF8_BYSSN|nr:GTP cyclohydrolase-2 [Paecilomyces variotii No. 5]